MKLTRILLLLLSYFHSSSYAQHLIDLKQCGESVECFVPQSCTNAGVNEKLLLKVSPQSKLKDDNCEVVLQTRFFSTSKLHIRMQVNATQSIAKTGVLFNHKLTQFGCTVDGPVVNDQLFQIASKQPHIYENNLVVCTFVLLRKEKNNVPVPVNTDFYTITEQPFLQYGLGTETKTITSARPRGGFWSELTETCELEQIESHEGPNEGFLRYKVDNYALPSITCELPKSILINRPNIEPIDLSTGKLMCDTTTLLWSYTTDNETTVGTQVPAGEKFNVACAVKFCSLCTPLEILTCPGCSPTNSVSSVGGNCATDSCPNGWLLESGKLLSGEVVCKKGKPEDDPTSKEAFWYSAGDVKITKAACLKSKDICWKESNLQMGCPSGKECINVVNGTDLIELSCPDGLKISHSSSSSEKASHATSLTCDFFSGKYKDESGNVVEQGANVYCDKSSPRKDNSTGGSDSNEPASAQTSLMIGGGVGGVVLLVIIIVIIVCVMKKRRAAEEEKKNKQPRTIPLGSAENPSRLGEADSNKDSVVQSVVSLKAPPPPPPIDQLPPLPEASKGPWLQRDRKKPVVELDQENFRKSFTEEFLYTEIFPNLAQYCVEDRYWIWRRCGQYEYWEDRLDEKRPYGHIRQVFDFMAVSVATQMDDVTMWERFFRFIRTYEKIVQIKWPKDTKNLSFRLKSCLAKLVRPFYKELGIKMMSNEDETTTWMRFFAVRALLWLGDSNVIEELNKMASLPFDQLESPIRAVVILYNSKHLKKGEEIKRDHWKTVLADPKDPSKDKFGTIRQHLLFGLAAYKDEKGKKQDEQFKLLKEIIHFIYDFKDIPKGVTPDDSFWAYRGAVEYSPKQTLEWAPASMQNFNVDETFQAMFLAKEGTEYEDPKMWGVRLRWEDDCMKTAEMMCECCWMRPQLMEVSMNFGRMECGLNNGALDDPAPPHTVHDHTFYRKGIANLERFLQDRKSEVALDEALKRIGH